mgnify:CR=1 FL=1
MTTTRRRPVSWRQKSYFTGSGDDLRPSGKPRTRRPAGVPFGQIPQWLVEAKITHTSFRVYCLMMTKYAHQLNGEDICYPSEQGMAKDLGISVHSVVRAISQLRQAGAIHVEPRKLRDGDRHYNLYHLHFEPPTSAKHEFRQVPKSDENDPRQVPPVERVEASTSATSGTSRRSTSATSGTSRRSTSATSGVTPRATSGTVTRRDVTRGGTEPDSASSSSSACGPSEDNEAAAPRSPREEAQDERHRTRPVAHTTSRPTGRGDSAARREVAAPVPRTVSEQFRKAMVAKYRMLSDVEGRIAQALNHRSSLNVLNPEIFVDGWLNKDRTAGANGQPDRMGAHRAEIRGLDYSKGF